MAEQLDSIVQIDGTNYEVVAETAKKVAVPLTIKVVNGQATTYTYDGSTDPKIELSAVGEASHATIADKVKNKLTIKAGQGTQVDFDGSTALSIDTSNADSATTAKTAEKTQAALTIKTIVNGNETTTTFNGSEAKEITVGDANKIKVNMDGGTPAYAAITISKNEPTGGSAGDIWFKYI